MNRINYANDVPTLVDLSLSEYIDPIRKKEPSLFQALCSKKFEPQDEFEGIVNTRLRGKIENHTDTVRAILKEKGSEVCDKFLTEVLVQNQYCKYFSLEINEFEGAEGQITDSGISVLSQCPVLKHIVMDSCSSGYFKAIDGSSIVDLAQANPNIKSLDLKKLNNLTEGNVVEFLQHLSSLERFALTSSQATTDEMIQALCEHRTIKELILHDCSNLTDKGIVSLSNLSNLSELILVNAGNIKPASFASILQKKTLECVVLKGIRVVDEMFTLLPEGFVSEITDLTLSSCEQLTQAGLDSIVKHFPKLEDLVLEQCSPELEQAIEVYKAQGNLPE